MAQALVNDGMSMMERMQRTGSFLPKGVAYAINQGHGPLRMVTFAELLLERKKRQAQHLRLVTELPAPRRAGFVWTFWTPGLGGFAYRGWWAYLRTIEGDVPLDFRGIDRPMIQRVMEMFPCGVLPIPENIEPWKEAFAHEYKRPGRFKKQGLAPIWISFQRGIRQLEPSN